MNLYCFRCVQSTIPLKEGLADRRDKTLTVAIQKKKTAVKYKLKRKKKLFAAVAKAAPRSAVVDCWRRFCLVASVGAASAQRSPLGWAMGSSQRLAAVAAVSHAKHYYNHTQPVVIHTETAHYNVNVFFVRLVTNNSSRTIYHIWQKKISYQFNEVYYFSQLMLMMYPITDLIYIVT